MAQSMTRKLDAGAAFPDFEIQLLDGPRQGTKQTLEAAWSVVLLYRGGW